MSLQVPLSDSTLSRCLNHMMLQHQCPCLYISMARVTSGLLGILITMSWARSMDLSRFTREDMATLTAKTGRATSRGTRASSTRVWKRRMTLALKARSLRVTIVARCALAASGLPVSAIFNLSPSSYQAFSKSTTSTRRRSL